jgi:hypothetical protein
MENENQKTISLPSGEVIKVKLPDAPTRNIRAHVIGKCKFHIPLRRLEKEIDNGRWPTTAILTQSPGELRIPESELWTGTATQWRDNLRETEATKCGKRVTKLRAIRKAQQTLKRISKEEWEALKTIFLIQRQFN